MKKNWSPRWSKSKQPRKQRKFRYNAPLHVRQKFVSAHLDKALRKDYSVRALPVRKGDEVEVMRGEFAKKRGSITKVDLKRSKVYIENIKRKKASGQEAEIAVDPSNVKITKLKLDDKFRKKFMKRKSENEKKV